MLWKCLKLLPKKDVVKGVERQSKSIHRLKHKLFCNDESPEDQCRKEYRTFNCKLRLLHFFLTRISKYYQYYQLDDNEFK